MKKKYDINKKIKRIMMIQSGAYDGRYKQKTFIDKKKEEKKRYCRKKNEIES
jgi:hypothetical protein